MEAPFLLECSCEIWNCGGQLPTRGSKHEEQGRGDVEVSLGGQEFGVSSCFLIFIYLFFEEKDTCILKLCLWLIAFCP